VLRVICICFRENDHAIAENALHTSLLFSLLFISRPLIHDDDKREAPHTANMI